MEEFGDPGRADQNFTTRTNEWRRRSKFHVCFVWVGSRGPITMLVYRLWYRRELPFTIHGAVAATIPIHAPFIPFNIE